MAARAASALLSAAIALGACDDGPVGPDALPELPWERAAFPAVTDPPDNPTTPAKVALGRLLFYDPILSSDGETACATCHSEIWGMGDGLPRSIGVFGGTLTGPGREGPSVGQRNAQTLWNVGLREELFWDGRARGLEEQALSPLHSEVELDKAPEEAVAKLAANAEYAALFADAFPEDPVPVRLWNVQRALAAFQRTLVSDRSLYDAYAAGDRGALTDEEIDGMWLFAEAGCPTCHTPPTFESAVYADRGLDGDDPGRYEVTGAPEDRGAFRTPTLRNVRDSEPYFHDGQVDDLLEAVRREVTRSANGPFTDDAIRRIFVFVKKGLIDRSREPDRPGAVPSGLPVPEDGFRIPR